MDEYGICLERAEHNCFRKNYMDGGTATISNRIQGCRDLAEVGDYVHQHSVRYGDLTGRNILLASSRNILLCDFAGSPIDGDVALVVAEPRFRHPDRSEYLQPTLRSEFHSLGSTFLEIVIMVFEDYEVEKLLSEGRSPVGVPRYLGM